MRGQVHWVQQAEAVLHPGYLLSLRLELYQRCGGRERKWPGGSLLQMAVDVAPASLMLWPTARIYIAAPISAMPASTQYGPFPWPGCIQSTSGTIPNAAIIFSAFGGVPSGPACSPVGILPLLLGAFGERACLRGVGLLVVSAFAGGKSFCW